MQEAVQALVRAGLRNPFRVNVAVTNGGKPNTANPSQKTPVSLEICRMVVPTSHKVPVLLSLLQSARRAGEKVIVYFLTCASVDYMATVLPRLPHGEGLRLLALHGGLKQRKVRRHVHVYTLSSAWVTAPPQIHSPPIMMISVV